MRNLLEGLFELQRAYLEHMRQTLGADCAHPRQGPILWLLLTMQGASQAELTRKLNVSAATVAVSIGRLERLGLVLRERNQRNQRAYRLTLTSEGRKQAETLRMAMQAAYDTAVKGIPETELDPLCALIHTMTDNLRASPGITQVESYSHEIHNKRS